MREPSDDRREPGLPPHPDRALPRRPLWRRRWGVMVFALLLVGSWSFQSLGRSKAPDSPVIGTKSEGNDTPVRTLDVPAMNDAGPIAGRTMRLAYREWAPGAGKIDPDRPAVLLVHGSPGDGHAFETTARPLAAMGYRVIAPDLPGFGRSERDPPSMSVRAHAHACVALLDALHIDRAHVVGWSLGGGVVVNMSDLAPERLASLTLLAAVSEQSAESSGSYTFEHAKYAAGWAGATLARYGLPHFGLLAGFDEIRASMRNFWDTDLRPMHAMMERLRVPTLILHGKDDPLVPLWAARRSHELIGPSTLIVTPYSHFMPFMQGEETGRTLGAFFSRHDAPGSAGERREDIRAVQEPPMLGDWGGRMWEWIRALPWWVVLVAVVLVVRARPRAGASLVFLMAALGVIDIGYAPIGTLTAWMSIAVCSYIGGRADRERGAASTGSGVHARSARLWSIALDERPVRHALGSAFVASGIDALWRATGFVGGFRPLVWALGCLSMLVMTVGLLAATTLGVLWVVDPLGHRFEFVGLVLGSIALAWATWTLASMCTRTGRRLLRMGLARVTHKEYWPTWVLYVLLAPVFVRNGLRHGPSAFTACNPTILGGGGMIGESKMDLLRALSAASDRVLPAELIPHAGSSDDRAARAVRAIQARPDLGGFPIILKPDRGLRGHAVRLARQEQDVREYFATMHDDALVQRYHPGPCECGVLWVKNVSAVGGQGNGAPAGFIATITLKDFPVIEGNGRRTLEDLIWRHPRFHRQARVFLQRFADERDRVLALGERVRLAQSGNHCQGTLFRDGAHLITPELTRAIDRVAQAFQMVPGSRHDECELDMARFDIRYESDDALMSGEGWAIVEVNGTSGESTNIYDPDRSIVWMWRTLAQQWRWLYELGGRRRAQGVPTLGLWTLIVRARRHFRGASGPSLAD